MVAEQCSWAVCAWPGSSPRGSSARPFSTSVASLPAGVGVLTVAHTMLSSARNRRFDMAVLGGLGADRPWVSRVVHWQATSLALLPTLLGVPLGLLVGREVFRWLADSIGAASDASFPYRLVLAVIAVSLVLANPAATIPARRARKLALAALLQPE